MCWIDVSFVWQSESSCSFGRYSWRWCLYCSGIGTISRIAAGAGTSARSLVLYEHNYWYYSSGFGTCASSDTSSRAGGLSGTGTLLVAFRFVSSAGTSSVLVLAFVLVLVL